MDADDIKRLIEQGLPGSVAEVASADGVHFSARVVSPQFAGQSLVQRHRLVNALLRDAFDGPLHALSLSQLVTPDEAVGGR